MEIGDRILISLENASTVFVIRQIEGKDLYISPEFDYSQVSKLVLIDGQYLVYLAENIPYSIQFLTKTTFMEDSYLNLLILSKLNDNELSSVCAVNSKLNQLCSKLWKDRLISKFGTNILKDQEVNQSYQQLYQQLNQILEKFREIPHRYRGRSRDFDQQVGQQDDQRIIKIGGKNAIERAAYLGKLEFLKWLLQNNMNGIDKSVIYNAIVSGRLHILQWLDEQGVIFDDFIDIAVAEDQLEIVKWFVQTKNAKPSEMAISLARNKGYQYLLKWLAEQGVIPKLPQGRGRPRY